jgi:hypothetical protein
MMAGFYGGYAQRLSRNPGDTRGPSRAEAGVAMGPKQRALIREALIVVCVLTILTLLARGHIAATVLIMVPLVFLIFGRRPDT